MVPCRGCGGALEPYEQGLVGPLWLQNREWTVGGQRGWRGGPGRKLLLHPGIFGQGRGSKDNSSPP